MSGLERQLFNLKFTSKQLQREARRCEKNQKKQKLQLKKAIEKGNMDGAKIYAENAIREKNQALTYLRLASRLDAVAARVQTAVRMRSVTRSMTGIVKNLEKAGQTMNLEKITMVMDQFEKQFEDLDVQSQYVEGAMNQSTSMSTPADQVDLLIGQVADEHGLNIAEKMGSTPMTAPVGTASADADDLTARLAKLKARS